MRFIEDETRPRHRADRVYMAAKDVVVGDDPARVARDPLPGRPLHDANTAFDGCERDFACPIALDRRWTDDEDLPGGRGVTERGKRLASLAEPHVVREEWRACGPAGTPRLLPDAGTAICERSGLTEGDVGVVGRARI